MPTTARSWGRFPHAPAAQEWPLTQRPARLPAPSGPHGLLAHGLGRSYGDVGLNECGTLLRTRGLDRFIAFDAATGVLRAEAGVSLDEILTLVMPQGWFLPVTPGTRYVTLGGAVANDVHGKNHHVMGSFGHHVRALGLLRSDGSTRDCSPTQHPDWLQATIGGLGLTGLILWVEIQLRRISRPHVWARHQRFAALDDYWALDANFTPQAEYAVSWVDCLHQGRGIFTCGDHAAADAPGAPQPDARAPATKRFPVDPPISLINGWSLRAFNMLYFHKPLPPQGLMHWAPFFYPLDALRDWNRVYGRRGFLQYQCVLPPATMRDAARALFARIQRSGQGSFLAVFKTFGEQAAPGLLSFPRPGATLALDFPHRGADTLRLMDELDAVVREAGGALYPAKDARMPPDLFRSGFPALERFCAFVDPAFSSSFWRRVMP